MEGPAESLQLLLLKTMMIQQPSQKPYSYQAPNKMQRKEKIQQTLKQLSSCEDVIFSCPDTELRQGFFEQKSQIDLQASNKNTKAEITSLLKIRARIRNWLNIAGQLQKRHLNQ